MDEAFFIYFLTKEIRPSLHHVLGIILPVILLLKPTTNLNTEVA